MAQKINFYFSAFKKNIMRAPLECVGLIILLSAVTNFCSAQMWGALNPPLNIFNGTIFATTVSKSGNIYAAGDFKSTSQHNFVATWNGTNWNELGSGASALNANGTILTLATYQDTIYAAGALADQSYYVAKWNGNSWSKLDKDNSLHANGFIYSIAIDKVGNLYAAGSFTNASEKFYVAKWNGTFWSEIGAGVNALNANNPIFALAVDASGNLYAGGYFTNASGREYVAKWDGHSWSELGGGTNALNANDFIRSIAIDSNGNVYAGGNFRKSNDEYYLAKWNGTTWAETGTDLNVLHANGPISSIAINDKNETYVAGYFTDGGGNYYVAKWDGVSWSQLNNSQSPLLANQPVQSICLDANDNIYAGGKFLNKSGHSFVAKWNGKDWNEMGSKGDPFYSSQPIYQIIADSAGSNVYVSGYFLDNGGRFHIEHWNGHGWQQLQIPDTAQLNIFLQTTGGFAHPHQMAIDKKGHLYVTGRRVIGENQYDCVLKWDGVHWSVLEDFPNSLGTFNDNPAYGINEIETDPQGNIYVAGNFSGPTYGICSLAKWDGNTWSRLPGSSANYIQNFCVSDDGNIYAYGGFTNEFGAAVIVNYNPGKHDNWEEVKNGNSRIGAPGYNIFMAIGTDNKNNLYVNGNFTNSEGNRYVAKWGGNSWSQLGVTSSLGWGLALDRKNNIYTTKSASSTENSVKKWNGISWVDLNSPPDVNNVFTLGSVLATDASGNIYTDASSFEPGVGAYIAKYTPTPFQSPKLFSFTPASGSVGTTITIRGKNLTGTSTVRFGGRKATSFTLQNDSTLTAVVANGSTGSVLVETIDDADSLKTFTYTCDSVKGPVPVISLVHDSILVSSYANYYQWSYNNLKLNNEISNSLNVRDAGFYRVETSEDKVCWVSSLDYPIIINRNPLSDSLKLNIYPNPSTGKFTVYVKLPQTTTVKTYVQVFDVNGLKVLETSKLIFYGDEIKIPITINNKGTFLVKVFVNDDTIHQSVIII